MGAFHMPFHMDATLAVAIAIAGACALAANAPARVEPQAKHHAPLPR